jgi:uncharacterized protein (DUF433 family)
MKETLIENIVQDKRRGVSDQEIGDKYGVNLRQIEKLLLRLKERIT